MTDDLEERVAKAICSSARNGFCMNVGGALGCKNGRGELGDHLCVASKFQLEIAHGDETRAAITACQSEIREECAKVADQCRDARIAAKKDAVKRKNRSEARDHESMAIEAIHIAQAIRSMKK